LGAEWARNQFAPRSLCDHPSFQFRLGSLLNRLGGLAVRDLFSQKERRRTQGTSAENSTQPNRTICVEHSACSSKPDVVTARSGSIASSDAGARRLPGYACRRQICRAHRVQGEKPSWMSVAPSADAPRGMIFPSTSGRLHGPEEREQSRELCRPRGVKCGSAATVPLWNLLRVIEEPDPHHPED